MTNPEGDYMRRVPERLVPVPRSLSSPAREALSVEYPRQVLPAPDDVQAWRAHIDKTVAEGEAMIPPGGVEGLASSMNVRLEHIDADGVTVYVATPDSVGASDPRIVLSLHAGGWFQMGGVMAQMMAVVDAASLGIRSWWADYRMLPDYGFPVPVDDCMTAYRALLRRTAPEDIVVSGTSAGGNLAAALVLRSRDEGLPMPAGVVLWTPALDLTLDGDSWHTNDGVDPQVGLAGRTGFEYYAQGHDLHHPYLSPLFGDLTRGFPPTILLTGTRDALLSDTVRFHRALRQAGVEAELHVFEAMPHTGFRGRSPEDAERNREIRRFVQGILGTPG